LSLTQNNENLEKLPLNSEEIEEIIFSNVDFKYTSSDKLILNNYNRVFSSSEINNLIGKNGTGKSTILYLILGMLKPISGKVLVKFSNGKVVDLNEEVNLKD
jgi:ABC-type bacteriocin/lantibiotic exporter with double-glycine peptidase domain